MCNAAEPDILCTDINKTGPSLMTFLRADQFFVVRFFFVGYITPITITLQPLLNNEYYLNVSLSL